MYAHIGNFVIGGFGRKIGRVGFLRAVIGGEGE